MIPKPNVPLLRKAVEWAEAEAAKPEELCGWYQDTYMLSAFRASGQPRAIENRDDEGTHLMSPEINGCGTAFCIAGWVYWQAKGTVEYEDFEEIDTFAQRELGLTHNQAANLFAGGNNIERVRRVAEMIAGEKL